MSTSFNAVAVVPVSPTRKRAEAWLETLASYSPAVGRTDRGLSELVITFPAKDMSQAVTTGWRLLLSAAGALEPGSFRVLPTDDYDREVEAVDLAPLPSLASVSEAAEIIGVSRQRVQQLIDAGQLRAVKAGSTWAVPRLEVEQIADARAAGTTVDG
ncbi:helix-turn-helix domain-containing protein [uncultured Jatrophihabitans sp.]|uniref:helix-turn-helix domain-containing protein n=1 Tax=uncultured Jatrophihabitans sp. TaxID=1610747 RepID=UPI0035CA84FF